MILDKETQEFLKEQVTYAPGSSQEQRERWLIIMSVHSLQKQLIEIDRKLSSFIDEIDESESLREQSSL